MSSQLIQGFTVIDFYLFHISVFLQCMSIWIISDKKTDFLYMMHPLDFPNSSMMYDLDCRPLQSKKETSAFHDLFSPDLLPNKLHLLLKGKQMGKTRISSSLNRIFLTATIALAFLEITFGEDPLWSNGQDPQLPNGKSVVRIRCSANAFELLI